MIAATDDRGLLVEDYRYRAFGEPTLLDAQGQVLAESAIRNPFLFTGREWDSESGLYYYRNRYYAQTLGRFLTQDTALASPTSPKTWHRYSYADNNPINRLDPLGLRAEAASEPSRMQILDDINRGGMIIHPIPPQTPQPQGDKIPEQIIWPQGDPIPEHTPMPQGDPIPEPENLPQGDPVPDRGWWDQGYYSAESGEQEGPKDPPPIPEDFGTPPGPEWPWKGDGPQGSEKGSYHNEGTDEYLHPDPNNSEHGPHWDYRDKDGNEWRRYPDGTWERK